ncbi:hypothetical protein BDB00DRAFT_866909 [Zychaea mexicana]|uniref:uncharacterized protein n=1 Tax=Zychaea mexicana TaxID=64656 RepID=UPI0022FEB749|nr:uncharacterized protein BDB00DRAFT_866909 [Zychaea mexicana]KAI9498832.1 hypothetical protein BDB00DRAFT_866909 [Zychaea mexicana]
MASLARPRANSEMISGSNGDNSNKSTMSSSSHNLGWIAEAFLQYTLPVNLNHDSVCPDGSGWTHRIQSRFLGVASLKIGSMFLPNMASFYEITESEISEIASSSSKRSSPLQESSDSNNDPDSCVDALLSLSTAEIFLGRSSPMALPPKKRKRRRVIRYDVVFCLDTPASVDPSPDREYFLFPRDAVVEAVNQASPFEVLVSYHLPKSSESSTLHSMCLCSCTCNNSYPSKLEEFAAVCSSSDHFSTTSSASASLFSSRRSSQRRLTDPGLLLWKPDCHVLNMQLSGVSRDMYIAMKQSVSGFETVCQRTMELMRLHTERLTCEKKEEAATIPMALTKTEIQSEEEDMYDKRPLPWSSDEDYEDEDVDDDYQDTDFCMTSPHSKSSSSARDSPPASSTTLSSSATTTTANNNNNNNHNSTTVPATTTTTTAAATPTTTTTSSSKRNTNSNNSSSLKKCLYCGSKSTPMWRRGPQGAGTLCNACGVKWKHGKILCGNDSGPLASSSSASASTPSSTVPSTTTSSSRRRSSSNKSSSSNNERKRKTTTKKRSKAKEQRNKQQQQRPPPPSSSSSSAIIMAESEDDDLMTGVVHYTTASPSIPRSIGGGAASSWEPQHASSLSSYSQSLDDTTFSPLESFSSSPNSSTSIHDSMMLDKYSAGVDAVEAATVLTLLKRS